MPVQAERGLQSGCARGAGFPSHEKSAGGTMSWAIDSFVETSQGPVNPEPSGAISPMEGCPGFSVMYRSGDT